MFFPNGGWAPSSFVIKFKGEGDLGSSKKKNAVLDRTVILWNKIINLIGDREMYRLID